MNYNKDAEIWQRDERELAQLERLGLGDGFTASYLQARLLSMNVLLGSWLRKEDHMEGVGGHHEPMGQGQCGQ